MDKPPVGKRPRGILTSIESDLDIPFELKRIFYMHHVISDREVMPIQILIRL